MGDDNSSEAKIKTAVLLAAPNARLTLWNNPVGKLPFVRDDGSREWVSYGLYKGSSDLIGFREVTITPEMVGKKVAVFAAIETKKAKTGVHSEDQKRFVSRVMDAGGISGFATSAQDMFSICRGWENIIKG